MDRKVVTKVVIVNAEGKILLLRRSATDVRRPLEWDIPGGHTDADELAEEAAVRETKEEADIELQPHDLRLVYAVSHCFEGGPNVTWLFYVAHVGSPDVAVSAEHTEHAWKTLDEAISEVEYERQKKAFAYIRDNRLLY